jgi:hypothetical protein
MIMSIVAGGIAELQQGVVSEFLHPQKDLQQFEPTLIHDGRLSL